MDKRRIEKLINGDLPMPNSAQTLGAKFLETDAESGTINFEFYASENFTNPAGIVQGGFLSAMLDETMGALSAVVLGESKFALTLELKTNFIEAAHIGAVQAQGTLVSMSNRICVFKSEVRQRDRLKAIATATALITKV